MAQTYAENGYASGERLDHAHRDSGILRGPGTRRNDQVGVILRQACIDGDGVVAMHVDLGSQHQEGLHQVVGEGVVVVDQQYLGSHL